MADDHPDLSELTRSPSPGSKRKRSLSEHESPGRSKKNAPPAVMSAADADTAAFIENAVEAANAAAAHGGLNVADLNALQQATAAEHSEAADPANASSTAAAALGSMYPSIHVPPTTEEQFAAQTANEASHDQAGSYPSPTEHDGIMDASGLSGLPAPPGPNTNGMSPPPHQHQHQHQQGQPQQQQHQPQQQPQPNHSDQHRYSTGSAGSPSKKPDVGSEEWHKMRKDNHKEGKSCHLTDLPPHVS